MFGCRVAWKAQFVFRPATVVDNDMQAFRFVIIGVQTGCRKIKNGRFPGFSYLENRWIWQFYGKSRNRVFIPVDFFRFQQFEIVLNLF